MDNNYYQILQIKKSRLDTYGDVFIVVANKAFAVDEVFEFCYFDNGVGDSTEFFIFPHDRSIINPIEAVCRSGGPWKPNMSEFRDGGLHFNEGRKVAHYHCSLVPIDERFEMTIIPEKITYARGSWYNLVIDEDDYWEFSLTRIETSYGGFDIEAISEVEVNLLYGVQFDVYGFLYTCDLPGFEGKESMTINRITVLRLPDDVRVFIHIYDDSLKHVACISGSTINVSDLSNYVGKFIQFHSTSE